MLESLKLILRESDKSLKFKNASLKLEQSSVLGVTIRLHNVHLPVDSIVLSCLLVVCAINLLLQFILTVKDSVFGL